MCGKDLEEERDREEREKYLHATTRIESLMVDGKLSWENLQKEISFNSTENVHSSRYLETVVTCLKRTGADSLNCS